MANENLFAINLKQIRTSQGIKQQTLADVVGVSVNTVGNWERGVTLPTWDTIVHVANFLGVSAKQLFDGKEPKKSAMHDVRIFGSIAAGTPVDMEDGDGSFPAPDELMRRYPRAFYLVVEGESMSRVLPNGSYALVDPDQREVISGQVYAVAVNGYAATVKRVVRLANGFELRPDSLDPTYRARVYDYGEEGTETITIIGRVVWYSVPFDYEI